MLRPKEIIVNSAGTSMAKYSDCHYDFGPALEYTMFYNNREMVVVRV